MAASLSRRLCKELIFSPYPKPILSPTSLRFFTDSQNPFSNSEPEPESEVPASESPTTPSSSSSDLKPEREVYNRPLENGLDVGIYKAILVGMVGQNPLQKRLRGGRTVTLLSVGTGGIRNNRRPFNNEEPREYANRCAVQWHRVSVYPERLGRIVMKHVTSGSILYLEGNLETKIFTDPMTGLVRRIREVALRQNGRIVFLGKGGDSDQATQSEFKGVGYY